MIWAGMPCWGMNATNGIHIDTTHHLVKNKRRGQRGETMKLLGRKRAAQHVEQATNGVFYLQYSPVAFSLVDCAQK